jgi:aspartyl/glutamyl-tRNA(Asn/Gln) amidotransferase C subunit
MEKKDIMHLASLARIRITDSEAEALRTDIDGVLAYVSAVNDITADVALTKKPGIVRNVFREDMVSNTPDQYTDALLAEAPQKKGRFLKVKKILQQD